jgi:hypothetical protein
MNLKGISKSVAAPARIFVTILILLMSLFILQVIVPEVVRALFYDRTMQLSQEYQERYSEEDKKLLKIADADKEFLPDGTIHLVISPERWTGKLESRSNISVFDVNNNLLWEGPGEDRPYKYLSWTPSTNRGIFTRWSMMGIDGISPDSSRSLEIPVRTKDKVMQIWRYLSKRGVFVGYDAEGGKIGYIGSDGLGESIGEVQALGSFQSFFAWCPMDTYSPTLLWQTSRRIYEINFETHQVELLLDSPNEYTTEMEVLMWDVYKAGIIRGLYNAAIYDLEVAKYRPMICCKGKGDKYHLIMRYPAQTVTVTIPTEWRKWMGESYRFTAMGRGIFMTRQWIEHPRWPEQIADAEGQKKWWQEYRAKPKKCHIELYRVDNEGNLALLNQFGWIMPGQPPYPEQLLMFPMNLKQYVSVTSPPVHHLLCKVFARELFMLANQQDNSMGRDIAQTILEFQPQKPLTAWLLGAAMGGLALLHARPRRTSYAKIVFWLAFTVLFSVIGLLTYLALNHTPTIKCQTCGRRRGLARPECPRCGVSIPIPQRRSFDLIFNI